MAESTEAQIARIDERLKLLMEGMDRDAESRLKQHDWAASVNSSLQTISSRLKTVEDSLTRCSPVIDEFITIKHKVVGAGILGKWAWAIGAGLIGFLYGARESIHSAMREFFQ